MTNEFKAEITTIEALKDKIINAPIQPKPICRSLLHTYDWKGYITPKLSDPPLVNHSKYNSFLIQKEEEKVKFRGKFLPQLPNSELEPRPGIRLIKENTTFEEPVGVAEFRVEDIKFCEIFKVVQKQTSKLPLEEKMRIISSWENLKKTLQALPGKIHNLKKMKLEELPKQRLNDDLAPIPDYLKDTTLSVDNQLAGDVYEEEPVEGDLSEVSVGTDVCVYTENTKGRPWVGRVIEILDRKKFTINWFTRSGRSLVFQAMTEADGSPSVSTIDLDSIMFWEMSVKRTEDKFTLPSYWIETIKMEYSKLDN